MGQMPQRVPSRQPPPIVPIAVSMPTDYYDLNDSALALEDNQRHEANVKACARHLKALVRVHGETPKVVQPPSWGRPGPRPVTYVAPSGISTWEALAQDS